MEAYSLENLISTMSVPDTLNVFIETHYNSEFVYSVWSHCEPHGTCWNHYISKFTALFLSKAIFCKISSLQAQNTPTNIQRTYTQPTACRDCIHAKLFIDNISTHKQTAIHTTLHRLHCCLNMCRL